METYLRAYGRAARRAGYEPHHFSVSTRTDDEQTDFGVVHRARSPFRPFRGLLVPLHQRFLVDRIDRFARLASPVAPLLIHSFGPWSGVGVAAAKRLRARGRRVCVVATPFSTYDHETCGKIRGLDARTPWTTRLALWTELAWTRAFVNPSERRGFRESNLVAVNYASVERIVREEARHGERPEGIRFGRMTYASEAAFLREGQPRRAVPAAIGALAPASAPLIVAVSRHDPRKGVEVLLRALSRLRARGTPFRACLVGGGELLDRHRQLAADLGGSAVITGRVPDAYDYLEHADIFALPSLEEGSGSVSLLEAMQAGAAPVVSNIDGLPEDVDDGAQALLVPAGDVDALAAALERLLTDAALRARIGAGARARYRERFSGEAFANDLRTLYTRFGFAPDS